MKRILTIFLFTTISFPGNGQTQAIRDGDKIHLRDSLDGKVVLLSYIERGEQNMDAIWITYDRRPGVDPWTKKAVDRDAAYSEDIFIKYWKERDIRILGAIITHDDCRCAKHRRWDSPDMLLIHFKIPSEDWDKLKDIYPEMENYLRKVKFK